MTDPSPTIILISTGITALFGFLSLIAKGVFDAKKEARQAKVEAEASNQSAITTVENTKNLSNGFAGDVVAALARIEARLNNLESAQREHYLWHIAAKGKDK